MGYDHHIGLESSAMVCKIDQYSSFGTCHITQFTKGDVKEDFKTRAIEKLELENLCLENLWRGKLHQLNWPEYCISNLLFKWVPSTLSSFNIEIRKYVSFCLDLGVKPENVCENTVADYFAQAVAKSCRSKSIVSTILVALSCYYDAIHKPSPISQNVMKMIEGSVKSGTPQPMSKSKVMPRHPFMGCSKHGQIVINYLWRS